MAERPTQNFENHANIPTNFMIVSVLLLISVIMEVVGLFLIGRPAGLCLIGTGAALGGVTTIGGLTLVRTYATKLQDRIIRTEMRIRLAAVLPDDLQSVISNLTATQCVALRFASDEEMPDLVRKVTSENITALKPIKQEIKDWQADWFRV